MMVHGTNAIKEKQTYLHINTGVYNCVCSKAVLFNTLNH